MTPAAVQERVARLELKIVELRIDRSWARFYGDGYEKLAAYDATIEHVQSIIARLNAEVPA